jgi:DtxR family transcriptional regulator, Mn-dependent transcriptional regulator
VTKQASSSAVQDYLKGLYVLEEEAGDGGESAEPSDDFLVSTAAVAGRLGVSAASATNMLKRLAGLGLVRHLPYRGAALTVEGRAVALEVIRHHRLLETYLARALGVPWDRVHEEAEVLEHVLSEDLEDRISAVLGDPTADPHGHPIPTKEGSVPVASSLRLWDATDGERVVVRWVSDEDPRALKYLADAGIGPGTEMELVGRGPVEGPIFVRVAGEEEGATHALSQKFSAEVWVSRIEDEPRRAGEA